MIRLSIGLHVFGLVMIAHSTSLLDVRALSQTRNKADLVAPMRQNNDLVVFFYVKRGSWRRGSRVALKLRRAVTTEFKRVRVLLLALPSLFI